MVINTGFLLMIALLGLAMQLAVAFRLTIRYFMYRGKNMLLVRSITYAACVVASVCGVGFPMLMPHRLIVPFMINVGMVLITTAALAGYVLIMIRTPDAIPAPGLVQAHMKLDYKKGEYITSSTVSWVVFGLVPIVYWVGCVVYLVRRLDFHITLIYPLVVIFMIGLGLATHLLLLLDVPHHLHMNLNTSKDYTTTQHIGTILAFISAVTGIVVPFMIVIYSGNLLFAVMNAVMAIISGWAFAGYWIKVRNNFLIGIPLMMWYHLGYYGRKRFWELFSTVVFGLLPLAFWLITIARFLGVM